MKGMYNPFTDPNPTVKQATKSMVNQEDANRILDRLQTGKTVNFVEATEMNIGQLSRLIDELSLTLPIYSRQIRTNRALCMEYSLTPY
jgi:hypothetical protein